jgi:hypothetical protein
MPVQRVLATVTTWAVDGIAPGQRGLTLRGLRGPWLLGEQSA